MEDILQNIWNKSKEKKLSGAFLFLFYPFYFCPRPGPVLSLKVCIAMEVKQQEFIKVGSDVLKLKICIEHLKK